MNRFNKDVFVEYMVKRKISSKDISIIIGSILGGMAVIYAGLLFLPYILYDLFGQLFLFLVCGVVFGVYKIISMRNLEFEYAITNGDLTIDKIMSRKARKRLTSFESKNIEEIGNYSQNAEKLKHKNIQTTIFAGVYEDGKESVYVIAQSRKTGKTLLVFDPSEKILDAMKFHIPREVRVDFYEK